MQTNNGFSSKQSAYSTSYDETLFEQLFLIEDHHFWFRIRRDLITTLVGQIFNDSRASCRYLEIGCGTGNLIPTVHNISSRLQVIGLDLFWEGLSFARRRIKTSLLQADINVSPFCANSFQIVGMFDVLEHLENDDIVLKSIFRLLTSGGTLLLTVPAHQKLWSFFDLYSVHKRRYEISELEEKLTAAGFIVDYSSEFLKVLSPIASLRKKVPCSLNGLTDIEKEKIHASGNHELEIIPILNDVVYQLLRLELKAIRDRKVLTNGTSIIAVARKP